ncbi:uncharacterized protein [Triticum aestivum]|uniref:uncharacterized protein n=1 Tax=Triticum aestivum TaxID=4565 RepID=UPI001D02EDF7|nr:uncharacterized protein LOC123108387 [Triticum aestivum]
MPRRPPACSWTPEVVPLFFPPLFDPEWIVSSSASPPPCASMPPATTVIAGHIARLVPLLPFPSSLSSFFSLSFSPLSLSKCSTTLLSTPLARKTTAMATRGSLWVIQDLTVPAPSLLAGPGLLLAAHQPWNSDACPEPSPCAGLAPSPRPPDPVCPAASPDPAARTLQHRRFLPPAAVSISSEMRASAARSVQSGVDPVGRPSTPPPFQHASCTTQAKGLKGPE